MKKIKRREFVKKSSGAIFGALVFPQIVPSTIFARQGQVAPSDRITLGCIGVGGMGTGNLRGFLEAGNVQVLAVCDVDRKHRDSAKRMVDKNHQNKDCATYNDYREVLARKDIDAISTATPDHWHGVICVETARAGKDIYAEKPLAFNISEGRAIVDAVHRYGVIWQTGSWQRSQRNFRFGCELVRNGRIGKVHTVRVGLPQGNNIRDNGTQPTDPPEGFDYDMWLGPAPWRPYNPSRCHWNFRWISDYSQGQLTDWAGHHCDIANWGMDTELSAPVSIEGKAVYPPAKDGLFDTAESYYFECEYKEGFKMIVADAEQQPKGMGAHFIGENGWVHVNRGGIDANPKSLLTTKFRPDEVHLYKSENHIQNFLDCIRTRQKTITPVEVAHHSVMVAHLGDIAMKLGRKVNWDPEKERFVNDPEANRYLSRPMRSPWHL
jgi:predicted dehydrogenase